MSLDDVIGHRIELGVHCAIDEVVAIIAHHGPVGGYDHDRQIVYLAELLVLGHSRTGHAGKLVIETEEVLQRDRREGLVLLAHMLLLFCLDGLVQALGIPTTNHEAAGELIDDHDFTVFDHIVDVALEQELRLERLLEMIDHLTAGIRVKVLDVEPLLDLADAIFSGRYGALRLVELEVDLGLESRNHLGERLVGVGGLGARAGDDERGSGLVNENRVDLVDDGERVATMNSALRTHDHIVAQVIEAELTVGAVNHVGLIRLDTLGLIHLRLNESDLETQELVDATHPLGVALGQIVVDGDHVNGIRETVEVAGQCRDQRLTFTGLHLGDHALVEHYAADELNIEVPHAQGANCAFSAHRERLDKQIIELLAFFEAITKLLCLSPKSLVGQRLDLGFKSIDRSDLALELPELPILAHCEHFGEDVDHGIPRLFKRGGYGGKTPRILAQNGHLTGR